MAYTRIFPCKSTKFFVITFVLLVILSSCVNPSNSKKPELLSPKNNDSNLNFNSVKLIFNTPTSGEYEVIVRENGTGTVVFTQVVSGGQSIQVDVPKGRLKPNTIYRWYVRLKGNDSVASEYWSFKTKENSAPTVSNLKPDKTSGHPFGALALTWSAGDADNDDLKFYVKVYEAGKDKPVFETVVATNSAVVKDLKQLASYEWSVQAEDPWGAKSELIVATFTTKQNEAPDRIELLNPRDGERDVKFNNLTLRWQGYDRDYEDLKYSVSLNDSQNLLSNSTLTEFTVTGLKPSTTYKVTVTAIDKYSETKTQGFYFTTKANTPPEKPTLIAPENGAKLNFAKITSVNFQWSSVSDPDEDEISYEFVVLSENNVVLRKSPVLGNSISLNISGVFEVGKTYTWYVLAKDPHGGIAKSDEFTFTTYRNNPPTVPTSPTPSNNADNLPNRIQRFTWVSEDPDGDSLTYDIYLGESPDNLQLLTSGLTTNVFETPRLFEFGKTYYWKVVVSDGYNPPVEGPVWSFKITNKDYPPTAPELLSPTNNSKNVAFNNVTLRWKASTDEETTDPAQLVYYLYIGQPDQMTLYATITGQTGSEISHVVAGLLPIKTYYWRVEVKDTFGNYAYSTTWNFTTKPNEAPDFPSNPNPADGSVIPSSSTPTTIILSWGCSDPDGDSLTYEIYIARTNDFTGVEPIRTSQKSVQVTLNEPGLYYWRVVVKDPHGGVTEGKVWRFELRVQ
ncbi:fibronectin type III domain-containing protein [Fervidobacterium sp.]